MSHHHHHQSKGKTRPVAGTWWDVPGPPGRSELASSTAASPFPKATPSRCVPRVRACVQL